MNAMFGGIAADFKVDMALGQWVTTLYMLVIGITVPVVTYLMRRFALKSSPSSLFAFLLSAASLMCSRRRLSCCW